MRRGYLVSLSFGNAPVVDLLVQSPKGILFTIDVKGQTTKNFWLIQRREAAPNHYFVFVYLPKNGTPEYFIASSNEVMNDREEYRKRKETKGKYRDDFGGFNWATVLKYKDRWNILPE